MKKLFALLMAMVMVVGMVATVSAAEPTSTTKYVVSAHNEQGNPVGENVFADTEAAAIAAAQAFLQTNAKADIREFFHSSSPDIQSGPVNRDNAAYCISLKGDGPSKLNLYFRSRSVADSMLVALTAENAVYSHYTRTQLFFESYSMPQFNEPGQYYFKLTIKTADEAYRNVAIINQGCTESSDGDIKKFPTEAAFANWVKTTMADYAVSYMDVQQIGNGINLNVAYGINALNGRQQDGLPIWGFTFRGLSPTLAEALSDNLLALDKYIEVEDYYNDVNNPADFMIEMHTLDGRNKTIRNHKEFSNETREQAIADMVALAKGTTEYERFYLCGYTGEFYTPSGKEFHYNERVFFYDYANIVRTNGTDTVSHGWDSATFTFQNDWAVTINNKEVTGTITATNGATVILTTDIWSKSDRFGVYGGTLIEDNGQIVVGEGLYTDDPSAHLAEGHTATQQSGGRWDGLWLVTKTELVDDSGVIIRTDGMYAAQDSAMAGSINSTSNVILNATASADKLTWDITPMIEKINVLMSAPGNDSEIKTRNDVKTSSALDLEGKSTTIRIPVTGELAVVGKKISIIHKENAAAAAVKETLEAVVVQDPVTQEFYVEFTTNKGFSSFELKASSGTTNNPGNTGTYYPSDADKIQSPKTFDAGIAVYGAMAIMSAAGAAWVTKKR